MSELDNPLLANELAEFDPSAIDMDALRASLDPRSHDSNGDGILDHWNQELAPIHSNHRGYIGDDGQLYRKEITYTGDGQLPDDWEYGDEANPDDWQREYTDERLYFWTPPKELGRAPDREEDRERAMAGPDGFGAAGLYTEAEIKAAWDAEEGMGYLKQHTTWDKYWNFIQRSTELFTDSEYNDMTDGNLSGSNWQDSPEYMALLEETGIPTQYINDDGDVFNFNGTTYVKDYKFDDSISGNQLMGIGLGLIGGFVAGPILATALGPTLGVAGAKAASSAIVSMASQYMQNGDIDFTQALISAATAYGGAKLGDVVKGAGAFGEIGEKMSEVQDKFNDLLSTGNSIADAAIKAGGMSLLTQLVTTGDVDIKTAGIAALMAGGTQAFSEWTTSMYDAGETVSDELLEEITVEAKRVGNDLGNGMYELDGVVFSETGGYIGNMTDLDLNGDGTLSGADLQNITTPDRDLVDPNLPSLPGPNEYYDADGDGKYTPGVDRDLRAPSSVGGAYDLSSPDYVKQFDAYSDTQMIDKLDQMGVQVLTREDGSLYINPEADIDPAIKDNLIDYLDARNQETYLTMNQVDHGGGLIEYKDQPYTVGITDEGQHYIIKTDELGNSKYVSIGEEEYNKLADFQDNENYDAIDSYLSKHGIGSTGTEFGEYRPDGTMVGDLNGDGIISSDEIQSGSSTVTDGDGWLVLDEGAGDNAVQVDDFTDATETPDNTPDTSDDSAPTGDPNEDTDATGDGSGGGDTTSTGGSADPGAIGGGGKPGGGADPGGSGGDINDLPPLFLPPLFPPVTPGTSGGPGGEVIDSTGDSTTDGNGTTSGGTTGGTTGGDNDGDGTGGDGDNDGTGDGTSDGDSLGDGTGTGDSGDGSGTSGSGDGTGDGTGEGGGAGDAGGTGGGTGGGAGGSTGGGTGTTTGPTYGTSPGPGGTGTGAGGGGDGGMLSGGSGSGGEDFNPSWGEMFAYHTPQGYQKKAVARQYKDYIQEAKGYLS
jgi:hypothetical protein